MDKLIEVFRNKPGYLKKGNSWLATRFNTSITQVKKAKQKLRNQNSLGTVKDNYLIISDLHIPFEHEDALDFMVYLYNKWHCNKVIFLGDILDFHFSSYHNISTRAKGAEEELELAKQAIKPWYNEFPNAFVCTSNHGDIPFRKAETAQLSAQWIKEPNEVLGTPNWKYRAYWEFPHFVATHGTDGKNLKNKVLKYGNKSLVQGHYHSDTKLEYYSENLFSMQLGCLIDKNAYAFEYAKNFSKNFILSAGVIVDGLPIIETIKY